MFLVKRSMDVFQGVMENWLGFGMSVENRMVLVSEGKLTWIYVGYRNWLPLCVGDRTRLDSSKGFQLISFMCTWSKWTWFQCGGSNLPFMVYGAKSARYFGVRWILKVSRPYSGTVHQFGTFMSENYRTSPWYFCLRYTICFSYCVIIFCIYLFSSWGNFPVQSCC